MRERGNQIILITAIVLFVLSIYLSWQKLAVEKDYTIYLKEKDVPSAENVVDLLKTEYFNKNI